MTVRTWIALGIAVAIVGCGHTTGPNDTPDDTASPTPSETTTPNPSPTPDPQVYPHLIPGDDENGFDADLLSHALRVDRQFHTFNAAPSGWSLDAYIPNAQHRQIVSDFLTQDGETDFVAYTTGLGTPLGADDVVTVRGEHGDLGMFGGVGAAGDAFRYMSLRDGGADPALVDAARSDLLDAIATFDVMATITGTPGTLSRGVRRLDEVGTAPATVALPGSCPAPGARTDTWRADASGANGEWMFIDNNSKDQLLGYVFALGAFWDAVADDDSIDASVKQQLQDHARAIGDSLMESVPMGLGGNIDLVIRDWNDCPTKHHDLNPRIIPVDGGYPIIVAEDSPNQNGWNALAALGIIRTLYHVSGDATLHDYYYDELVTARDYPTKMVASNAPVSAMYINSCVGNNCFRTNFSNVNMAFVAVYGLLRYETDPALRDTYRALLRDELWDTPKPHDGAEIQQALYNVLWAAYDPAGTNGGVVDAATDQLGSWWAPPYYNPVVTNCDAAELAAESCVAIDGVTIITLDPVTSTPAEPRADTVLPIELRPPSNFEFRSDPYRVNGGGGFRVNPAPGFRASYWMGRVLFTNDADTDNNVSPHARD